MLTLQQTIEILFQDVDVIAVQGDCLDILRGMCYNRSEEDKGSLFFDACITDVPYNRTKARWDQIIKGDWAETLASWVTAINNVTKNSLFVTTAQQPFTTELINANRKYFRDALVWDKVRFSGPLNAKKRPLRSHEDILIFYEHQPNYTPQMRQGYAPYNQKSKATSTSTLYGKQTPFETSSRGGERFPISILSHVKVRGRHPTKKPIALYEWLIRSYTRPQDIVLDPFAGEFTTGIAAAKTNRKCLLVEKDPSFFEYGCTMLQKENVKYVVLDYRSYIARKEENNEDNSTVLLVHHQA